MVGWSDGRMVGWSDSRIVGWSDGRMVGELLKFEEDDLR